MTECPPKTRCKTYDILCGFVVMSLALPADGFVFTTHLLLPPLYLPKDSAPPSNIRHSNIGIAPGVFPLVATCDHITETTRWRDLPLHRSHERSIFSFYAFAGVTSSLFWLKGFHTHIQIETGMCLIWSGMVLAVSFLEAWVKFKAPFLRKHVAVDVGRHVFAALNAAELGLSFSFWAGRLLVLKTANPRNLKPNARAFLPALATAVLLLEVLFLAPKLFSRAKYQIVKGLEADEQGNMSPEELTALQKLADEVKDYQTLPSAKWHLVYVLLEVVKVVCLNLFVGTSWRRSMA